MKGREESITAEPDVALQVLQAAGVDHVLLSIAIPLIVGLEATTKNRLGSSGRKAPLCRYVDRESFDVKDGECGMLVRFDYYAEHPMAYHSARAFVDCACKV